MGPSVKYVTLFWTNFSLLPLVTHCHTSRNPSPKVCHTSRNPPIFSSIYIRTYICLYKGVCLSSGGFVRGFTRGLFVWKVLYGVVLVRPHFFQNITVTAES